MKTQGNFAASPLVYNQKSTLIENTPQVHKRKASFKVNKSGAGTAAAGADATTQATTTQNHIGSFTQSVLADKRYSPVKSGGPTQIRQGTESASGRQTNV